MKIGLCYVLFALLFSGGSFAYADEKPAAADNFFSGFERDIRRWMRRFDIPGVSVAVVREGEIIWSCAFGYADIEQGRALRTEIPCRVESISKSVTALGVMRLVEQGKIDLEAPVERYLGDWKPPASAYRFGNVTVGTLLSHTSGLPLGPIGESTEYAPGEQMPTLRDYLSEEAHLIHPPGERFLYSNVGFNLLELLIENVTGVDFADYMSREILRPLGMHEASFTWRDGWEGEFPMGYEQSGEPVSPYLYPVRASGGLMAPVEDIARFVVAEIAAAAGELQHIIPPEAMERMHTPVVEIPGLYGVVADTYGLGHFIETLPNGQSAFWHGGQGHGWMTHFHVVPSSGDGIVVLTNSERSWPFLALVLRDWARWCGLDTVKMSRISYAVLALHVCIGIIVVFAAVWVIRLVLKIRKGSLTLAPSFQGGLSSRSSVIRLMQLLLGAGLIGIVWWGAAQPYLIFASIFPATIGWAAACMLLVAAMLLVSACLRPSRDCA